MTSPPSPFFKTEYQVSTTPKLESTSAPTNSEVPKLVLSQTVRTMSSTTDSEVSSHPTLKLTGVEQLKPPGSESNYLDWSWILEIHFMATDVDYIISEDPEKAKLKPNWARDNKAVCGIISRTIHPTNIRKRQTSQNRCPWAMGLSQKSSPRLLCWRSHVLAS
jgi:hypothetical protein